jgi:hypothetical protein
MVAEPIKFRDSPQSPQHIRQMTSKHSAVGVQFIEHDVTQVLEKAHPFRVVGQDSGVQHVRIREDDVSALSNRFSRVTWGIAVVGEYSKTVVQPF